MSTILPTSDAAGAKVFISYSRRDLDFVDRLAEALQARAISPVIDRTEIYAFETWWTRIEALIAAADTIIFVLSPDAIASSICHREVDHAMKLQKRFAPIVCRSVADEMDKVPAALADLNFIFFDAPDRFDAAMTELVAALSTDIGWVRQHTAFGLQAADWAKAGRPGGLLLRSPRLEEAERWIASRPSNAPVPTREVQDFLRLSRAGATRRRNMLTGALAAGLLIAVGLAGVAFWQRQAAIVSEGHAREEKRKAEASASAAEGAARSLVFDFAQGIRDRPGMPQDLVELILGRADKVLKALSDTLPDERRLLQLRAEGLLEIGETLEKRGSTEQAKYVYRESRTILEKLVETGSDDRLKDDLAVARNRIGLMLLAAGDVGGAQTSLQAAYEIRKGLSERSPGDPHRRLAVALDQANLASVKMKQNAPAAALSLYDDARRTMKFVSDDEPTNLEYLDALGNIDQQIGDARRAKGDNEGALSAFREYNAIFAKLCAANRNDTRWTLNLGLSHDLVGEMLELREDLPAALDAYRKAQGLIERVTMEKPDAPTLQVSLARVQMSIGDVLLKQSKNEDAGLAFTAARSLLEDVREKEPGNRQALDSLVEANIKFGIAEEALFAPNEAIRAYETGQSLIKALLVKEPVSLELEDRLAFSFDLVGRAKRNKRDIKGALAAFEASLAIKQSLVDRRPADEVYRRSLLSTSIDLGDVLLRDGQIAKARDKAAFSLDLAIRIDQRHPTSESKDDLKRATALSHDVNVELQPAER